MRKIVSTTMARSKMIKRKCRNLAFETLDIEAPDGTRTTMIRRRLLPLKNAQRATTGERINAILLNHSIMMGVPFKGF